MSTGGAGAVIEPTERRAGFVLRADGHLQSYVDLDDPRYLAFDYVRRLGDMLDGCAAEREPIRVVHVGGAAMSLPRYVAATRPRSAQIVLEPDTVMTERVRAELPLPARSGIKVRPVDGRTGLGDLRPASVDVLLVDAFAHGRVPSDLVTCESFEAMAKVLDHGGLVFFNLVDRAPFSWSRRVVAAARTVFGKLELHVESATLRGRRPGNVILVASNSGPSLEVLGEHLGGRASLFKVLQGSRVADSFGGAAPFTDLDTEQSAYHEVP